MPGADEPSLETGPEVAVSPRFVFDVSSLLDLEGRRVSGIERVILETVVVLVAQPEAAGLALCRFDQRRRVYLLVGKREIESVVSALRAPAGQPDEVGRPVSKRSTSIRAERWAGGLLSRAVPGARVHAKAAAAAARVAFREVSAVAREAAHMLRSSLRRSAQPADECFSASWSSETTYCSVGHDWVKNDLAYLRAQKLDHGFRVRLMVHDLIQFVAPEFVPHSHHTFFDQLLDVADEILISSRSAAADIAQVVEDRGRACPEVVRVRLGSALHDLDLLRPADPRIAALQPGQFVLCVGTLTIRKNHHLLFDVWELMIRNSESADVPTLVIAGAVGWTSEETVSRLRRSNVLRRHVIHLEQLSDQEVAWLYANCAFTLYPSLYEGWGLPVSESLDFGKLCICSDRSSLPEAGEGLAIHLDPVDRAAWVAAVDAYWQDESARHELERRIRAEHRRVTAEDTARSIVPLAIPLSSPLAAASRTVHEGA